MSLAEYREHDYNKIEKIFHQAWAKLHELDENFTYNIDKIFLTSPYTQFSQNYEIQYIIEQKFNNFSNEVRINVPQLKHKQYFILGNSYYIPTFMLERLPIDKNSNKDRVFLTINNSHSIAFYYNKRLKKYQVSATKKRKLTLEQFVSVVFEDYPERIETLKQLGIIKKVQKYNGAIKEVAKAFGFFNYNYFKTEMRFNKFMNEYYLLPYFKGICEDVYGTSKFEDLAWECIKLMINSDIHIDLVDLRNRRLVMSEYLIAPIIDLYYRVLNIIIDNSKTVQLSLPSVNSAAVMSTGFRNFLHGKQLFDITVPFAAGSLYNKISQKIQIVSETIPKSWTGLHDTHYRIIDPVAVSAGALGHSLLATSLAKVDEHGIFHVKGCELKRTFPLPKKD